MSALDELHVLIAGAIPLFTAATFIAHQVVRIQLPAFIHHPFQLSRCKLRERISDSARNKPSARKHDAISEGMLSTAFNLTKLILFFIIIPTTSIASRRVVAYAHAQADAFLRL